MQYSWQECQSRQKPKLYHCASPTADNICWGDSVSLRGWREKEMSAMGEWLLRGSPPPPPFEAPSFCPQIQINLSEIKSHDPPISMLPMNREMLFPSSAGKDGVSLQNLKASYWRGGWNCNLQTNRRCIMIILNLRNNTKMSFKNHPLGFLKYCSCGEPRLIQLILFT